MDVQWIATIQGLQSRKAKSKQEQMVYVEGIEYYEANNDPTVPFYW